MRSLLWLCFVRERLPWFTPLGAAQTFCSTAPKDASASSVSRRIIKSAWPRPPRRKLGEKMTK